MWCSLSVLETTFYLYTWCSGVFVSLYYLFQVGQVFAYEKNKHYIYDDFAPGWSFLGRHKDVADYEWRIWSNMTVKLLPWLLVNLLGAEYCRSKKLFHWVSWWYAGIAFLYSCFEYGVAVALFLVVQVFIFYLVTVCTKKHSVLWLCSYLMRFYYRPEEWLNISEEKQYLIMLSSSWTILRCLGFCFDQLNEGKTKLLNINQHVYLFIRLLGYTFYLPMMYAGPLILFEQFDKNVERQYVPWTGKRIAQCAKSLLRCVFWFYFTEFALHFIYVNAIVIRPYIVEKMSPWELAGLGIGMGHFFLLKYVVFYGIPCAWAAAEEYQTPQTPCCVSRVYLYSYMWRHFDEGLYKFLLKYIYIPISSNINVLKRTMGSIACFSFIYLWHGGEQYVLYWTLLNLIAVSIEALVRYIYRLPHVGSVLEAELSPQNLRRLHCFLAAPLYYFSMVANYYFIGCGMEVGNIFMKQFLIGNVATNAIVLFFLYGASQSSVTIEMWEKQKKGVKKVE